MISTHSLPQLPSQDLDAERAILGALLLDETRLADAQDLIEGSDFYHAKHGSIFSAMIRLSNQNERIDTITLSDQLQRDGCLKEVGGSTYLAELIDFVPSASNIMSHCRLVRDHSRRRRLTVIAHSLLQQGYEGQEPIEAMLDSAEQQIFALRHRTAEGGFQSIGDLSLEYLSHLEALSTLKEDRTGLPSGITPLDRLMGGVQPGDLIIIGARPAMGKTALALSFARHATIQLNRPVALFSLEMPKRQLTQRILTAEGHVDAHMMRTGRLDLDAWKRIETASQRLDGAPLFIDDSSMLSVSQLRSKARRIKARQGADLIVIDYLQLMQLPRDAESRQQGMADISRDLKLLARELEIPVIALAQLNREVEKRNGNRPQLSDLRDSGAFEQDADVVMFLYRDEAYDPDSPDKGIAELLIRKHRNGPLGEVRLAFIDRYVQFAELDPCVSA